MTKPIKSSPPTEPWSVVAIRDSVREEHDDAVVVEEPLEIRAVAADGKSTIPITVTMRTPGHDIELAAGLLYTEGLVSRRDEIIDIREAARPRRGRGHPDRPLDNCVEVQLKRGVVLDPARTARTLVSTAACGVCGKATIEAVFATGVPLLPPNAPHISRRVLERLPERMATAQPVFAQTGGIHAAALFDATGDLLTIREDVGRHNAVDKVIGARFLTGSLPASETILITSGRAGFEITQKALMAGIPVVAAVGAPSSLSLRLASRAGMTLVGFLGRGRCNLYTGRGRVVE